MNSQQQFRIAAIVLILAGGAAGHELGHRRAAINNMPQTSRESIKPSTFLQARATDSMATAVNAEQAAAAGSNDELSPQSLDELLNRLHTIVATENASERSYYSAYLFDAMTPEQAPMVFAELLKLPAGPRTRLLLVTLFRQWGRLDGPGAVEASIQLDDQQRALAASAALAAWSENAPMAAWTVARDMARDWPLFATRLNGVIRELAKHDLPTAVSAHREIGVPSSEYSFRQAVLQFTFSDQGNVDATLREISRFDSLEDRSQWISALFSHWATADETAPLAALQNLTDPVLAEHALAGLLTGWTASDPEAAIDYMLAHSDDKTVVTAFPGAIRQLAYIGDRSALLAAVEKMIARDNGELLLEGTISSLTSYQPEMAVELAATLDDERQRSIRTASAVRAWAQTDFDAAAAYFETMPRDETKAQTLALMSPSLLPREDGGTRLLKWMSEITDERLRLRTLTSLIRSPSNARPSSSSAAALKQLLKQTPNVPPDVQRDAARLLGEPVAPASPAP